MNDRLTQVMNNDNLKCQICFLGASIMQQVEEQNICCNSNTLHIFLVDNFDWMKKTLERGSCNVPIAIVTENHQHINNI